jgi:phenylpropionate dioxygenase-like ring-hydroxylating dioxygenase large terminal subunit
MFVRNTNMAGRQERGRESLFHFDQWYVAALSNEIGHEPLGRRILDEDVVLYRTLAGSVIALRDRCPHRRFPLSRGHLVGDELVCGYHGFTFDCAGHCVRVPGQERIPNRADVRSYSVAEQGAWTWIFMGEAEPSTRPPATPWLESAQWTTIAGLAPLQARVELLLDNLLDLSHESFLHGGFIGTPEVAEAPIETSVDEERCVVRVNRHMSAVECPPFYARSTGLSSPIDRWQDIEYFPPGYYLLHVRIAPSGHGPAADGGDPGAFHMKILYGLTPSDASSTLDFWAVARDFALADAGVSDYLDKMQSEVVRQDVEALGILEARVSRDGDDFEVSVKIDRGALAARRLLAALP